MSIISVRFLLFLITALLFYFRIPGKHQWKALLIISYLFYLISGLETVVFLVFTSLSAFWCGNRIGKINEEYEIILQKRRENQEKITRDEKLQIKAQEDKRKKKYLVMVLVANFGILLALKYTNVLKGLSDAVSHIIGMELDLDTSRWLVPIGISYYTFQSMGYLIDLYRRKYRPESNVFRFMLFVSFFPQLIQGPISRYDELAPKLYAPHPYDYTRVKHGVELAAWGLFKKLVISDRIAIMTGTIFGNPAYFRGFYLVFATIFGMFQLYTDFSGGIDLVRGIGEMFGVDMPENFTRPFFARNVAEYWRRWHITLNNWWRDYIFYPLTLSRPLNRFGKAAKKIAGNNLGKKLPILVSIIIIRIINSIWHGATGSSVLAGLYYGILLALSFTFDDKLKLVNRRLRINTECCSWKIFQCVRTFLLIAAPRLVSQAGSLQEGKAYCRWLFGEYNPWILTDGSLFHLGVTSKQFIVVIIGLLCILVVGLVQETGRNMRDVLDRQNTVFRVAFCVMFFYMIVLFGVYGSGYDASSFAYAQY